MSNISMQFVFALVMLVASISASFAQLAGSATTHRNVPIALGSRVGKCLQGRPARTAAHNSAQFFYSGDVCRLPLDTTEGPGV